MINIISAKMEYSEDNGYVGSVSFQVEGHKYPYEVTLQSNKGRNWMYALSFLNESGSEEEISEVEERLEEDDEWFDQLVEAAKGSMQR